MMLIEVTAPRLMAPYFGTSAFTWTNVIGGIMAALAAGYYLGGKLADRRPQLSTALWLTIAGTVLIAGVPALAPALSSALLPPETSGLSSVPLHARASLLVTLVVFAPPLLLMGALSPVVVRQLTRLQDIGGASGANSTAATTGALLGTFLPTLWLIPTIGSRLSIALAAAVMAIVTCALAIEVRCRAAALIAMGAAIVAFSFGAKAGPLRMVEGMIDERETQYQLARVVQDGTRTELQFDTQFRGAQSVHVQDKELTGEYFDYLMLLPFLVSGSHPQPLRVLILGLGSGTVPRQYQYFIAPTQRLEIEAVEIDPALVQLGRKYFDLARSTDAGLTLHIGDGRSFLRATARQYDVIVLDVFSHQEFLPFQLASVEFFRLVRQHLAPGGVLGMNIVVRHFPSSLLDAVEKTVLVAFGSAWHFNVPDTFNVQLIACRDRELDLAEAARKASGYRPESVDPGEAAALRDLMVTGLQAIAAIAAKPNGLLLTDDRAPVEQLMLADIRAAWAVR